MANEIKEKINQDFSSTLVLILDNMGRQKALAALEIYREHEKFRKSLEMMQDGYAEPKNEPVMEARQNLEIDDDDDDFLRKPSG